MLWAVIVGFLVFLVSAGSVFYYSFYDKVDPGNIGILVDRGDGSIEAITETKWILLGWYQDLHEYPAGEQTYIMDAGNEGQIKGDDAVVCLTKDTQNIKLDSHTTWRINPATIVETYKLRRDVPLTGKWGREQPENTIEDVIVRNVVRASQRSVCAEFGWAEILGERQLDFQERVDTVVKGTIAEQGAPVLIGQVTIRNRVPSEAVQQLMTARLEGQKQQEASAFAAAQARRTQEIELTTARATQERARVDAEGQAVVARTKAEADAAVARVKAEQEAEAIRSRGNAEAESLRAQASAVNPALVDLERARKWDGKGPTTILGGDTQAVNQIPVQR